ncbi:hypothetical protein K503DRAFT_803526 [Rhizopogon vinicolor AM-OR11-026]|uniref:Uncharacterized protein n=1 Tax=Rhizopogon vinicolor AM-OR11-026 TaxID=1314800 RepID=A0A1B7MPH5_9AGAM|nr:hypothetical protein K503DRAFT_803526 [Rhizopogon vinicolor AM-OR11-026]
MLTQPTAAPPTTNLIPPTPLKPKDSVEAGSSSDNPMMLGPDKLDLSYCLTVWVELMGALDDTYAVYNPFPGLYHPTISARTGCSLRWGTRVPNPIAAEHTLTLVRDGLLIVNDAEDSKVLTSSEASGSDAPITPTNLCSCICIFTVNSLFSLPGTDFHFAEPLHI